MSVYYNLQATAEMNTKVLLNIMTEQTLVLINIVEEAKNTQWQKFWRKGRTKHCHLVVIFNSNYNKHSLAAEEHVQ